MGKAYASEYRRWIMRFRFKYVFVDDEIIKDCKGEIIK